MGVWDSMAERAKQVGGGKHVRLQEDGEKIVCAFLGDPEPQEVVWDAATNKYVMFDPATHKGKSPSLRAKINVYVKSTAKKGKESQAVNAVKILEMNVMTVKDLLKVRDKYTLDNKWWFELERSGAKGDTKTTYTILPDTQITDDEKKMLVAAELHNLATAEDDGWDENAHPGESKPGGAPAPATDGPIDTTEFDALVLKLKTLPKEKLAEFTKAFSIAKVKELKKSQLAAAHAWAEKQGAPPPAPVEVDPFA